MTSPDIVALSLGAGVQSTTLALLAVEGVLPKPDVAIFADTGWEPAAVYAHLDRLEVVLKDAGIEPMRVSKGNLRADMLDPTSRFAALPYFTLAPEYRMPVRITCPVCDGEGGLSVEADEAWVSCTACGGDGRVDHPTETRPATRAEREGMGRRQCTSEYKLGPIRRSIRALLGAAPPDFKRVPHGLVCEQWVGFSTDEVQRANRQKDSNGVSYLTTRYPLLDLGMSRRDCERWLGVRGWSAQKSACIGCPYHGNRQWRALRDGNPVEWADAVDFDAAIRKGGASASGEAFTGEAFLHRSRVPLNLAPIDRVTRSERAEMQGNIFDAIADIEAGYDPDEDGDPDGCSPYGCRSGDPVDGAA